MVSVVLTLMNTYFLTASRDMIFKSKQSFVRSQAMLIETALGDFETLTIETVRQVMQRLDVSGLTTVTVSGLRGNVLYDTTDASASEDRDFIAEYTQLALDSNDVYYARFKDGAFRAGAFVPITRGGAVTGAVFVYEHDAQQGAILVGMQNTMRQVTVVVVTLSVLLIAFILWTVLRRITSILRGIESVRAGEYTYRIDMGGGDELAVLADEFNSLTHRLRETEDVRRRFVADASHELRTPLAAVRLLADSILQNENIDSATVREFVADIGEEAERLARTTEKLMTLTRIDSKISETIETVDLQEAVLTTVRMLTPLAERENIALNTDLVERVAIRAGGDAFHRIIYNLAENAIKYNVPNGSVDITLRRSHNAAELTVADTGIGVPAEDLPYIFDRFYRVDKARSRAAGGSGLGLSIARDTAREYGGDVSAQPNESGGMTFTVKLPLSD